uniref:DMT family transporter n=1 Tax=Pararhizobium sp. IMCC3301 TaxID=3067904 RepID=UPI00274201C3|nr:DMT family transporter [Pararhizobium sp. IMCC3301]
MSGLLAKANEDRVMTGIVLMLGAYLFFAFIDVSAKWLALAGLPALQLAFMRYLGHFLISLFLIAKGGLSMNRFSSEKMGLVLLRAALLMGSTILNFISVRYLPLTLTSTILFSAPIIICALSWPLLGERVGFWRWSAIMIGFVGILIAIRPFDESFHWAVTLSLGAAFCFALYSILTRKLAGIVAVDTMQFYSGLVGTMVLLPFAVSLWQNPATGFDWTIMVAMGIFGWLGHQLLTNAHRFAPASTLTPFGYTFILYLTLASYFVFDHLPDRWTILGGSIIIVSGLIIWFRERKLSRVPDPM